MALGQGIDMNRDKQVGFIIVGNLRTTIEFHKLVSLTGIDDLHIRTILLHQLSKGEGEFQGQILLTGLGHTDGTSITATMSGIDNQREPLVLCISRCHTEKKRYEDEQYLFIHLFFY